MDNCVDNSLKFSSLEFLFFTLLYFVFKPLLHFFFQQQKDKQTQPIQSFYLFSFITDTCRKKYADPIRNNVWNIIG